MPRKLIDHRIIAAAIINDLAQEGRTTASIADELNARGLKTLQGKQWTWHNVARVMRRTGIDSANKRRPRDRKPIDSFAVLNARKDVDELAGLALLLSAGGMTVRFSEHGNGEGTFALAGPVSDLHSLLVGTLKAPRKARA